MLSPNHTLVAALVFTGFSNIALSAQETAASQPAEKPAKDSTQKSAKTPKAIAALKLRSIGPAITSGRISDIAIEDAGIGLDVVIADGQHHNLLARRHYRPGAVVNRPAVIGAANHRPDTP